MRRLLVLAAVMAATGCTLDKQSPPSLAGPSQLGLSISMSVTPDIITQDGQSQSAVDITARDPNGQPVRGLTLRLDLAQGSQPIDFGTLSAKTVSTNSDGRASVIFTAPPPPPPTAGDSTVIQIVATPVGSNFDNSQFNAVSLKLVRPGAPLGPPPSNFEALFTISPNAPKEGDTVHFDASASHDDSGQIVSYVWNFGDGGTGTGIQTSHSYSLAGQYSASLTITDNRGFTTSSSQTVAVGSNADPVAAFAVSPTTPIAGTVTNFNAAASKAAPGRTITSYAWDFGDGTTGSGLNVQHTYALPSGYNVTLVVTDNTGHVGVNTQTVSVASSNPTAAFSITPQSPHTTDVISLDGSGSSAVLGRVIVTYAWEFSGAFVGTASGSAVSVGPVGGSGGTLTIKLTVTDSAGQIGILSKTIQIQP